MSDKKNKKSGFMQRVNSADITANDAMAYVTKYRGKKGKIKVPGDKKTTKMLKRVCPHHRYNGGGKVKSTVASQGGRHRCMLCGKFIDIKPVPKNDIAEMHKTLDTVCNQLAYLSIEAKVGDENITKAAVFTKAYIGKMIKSYERLGEMLSKNGKKRKDKGNHGSKSSKSTLTSWIPR